MKIDPLKLSINDEEVTFGVIGFRVYVDATDAIRQAKERAFSRVVANLSQDPLSAPSTAASAIDGYMSGMIVSDYEVRQWLFSPEGEYFMFGYSIKRDDPDIGDEKVSSLYDSMSVSDKIAIGDFFTLCITKTLPASKTPPSDENDDKQE